MKYGYLPPKVNLFFANLKRGLCRAVSGDTPLVSLVLFTPDLHKEDLASSLKLVMFAVRKLFSSCKLDRCMMGRGHLEPAQGHPGVC